MALTLTEFKEKFPVYKDWDDEKLAQGMHKKFYSNMSYEEFANKIGHTPKPVEQPKLQVGGSTSVKVREIGEDKENEFMSSPAGKAFAGVARTIATGVNSALLGIPKEALSYMGDVGKDVKEELFDREPENVVEALSRTGAEFLGFLGGPLKISKWALGKVLMPKASASVATNLFRSAAKQGAELGLASGISTTAEALSAAHEGDITALDAAKVIGESMASGFAIGATFPALGFVPTKPLRVAAGLGLMDVMRNAFEGKGLGFTVDDTIKDLTSGSPDYNMFMERAFGHMVDIYFSWKTPTIRQQIDSIVKFTTAEKLKIEQAEILKNAGDKNAVEKIKEVKADVAKRLNDTGENKVVEEKVIKEALDIADEAKRYNEKEAQDAEKALLESKKKKDEPVIKEEPAAKEIEGEPVVEGEVRKVEDINKEIDYTNRYIADAKAQLEKVSSMSDEGIGQRMAIKGAEQHLKELETELEAAKKEPVKVKEEVKKEEEVKKVEPIVEGAEEKPVVEVPKVEKKVEPKLKEEPKLRKPEEIEKEMDSVEDQLDKAIEAKDEKLTKEFEDKLEGLKKEYEGNQKEIKEKVRSDQQLVITTPEYIKEHSDKLIDLTKRAAAGDKGAEKEAKALDKRFWKSADRLQREGISNEEIIKAHDEIKRRVYDAMKPQEQVKEDVVDILSGKEPADVEAVESPETYVKKKRRKKIGDITFADTLKNIERVVEKPKGPTSEELKSIEADERKQATMQLIMKKARERKMTVKKEDVLKPIKEEVDTAPKTKDVKAETDEWNRILAKEGMPEELRPLEEIQDGVIEDVVKGRKSKGERQKDVSEYMTSEDAYKDALETWKELGEEGAVGGTRRVPSPSELAKAAKTITLYKLERTYHSLKDFTESMVKEFGERIKPYVAEAYEWAQSQLKSADARRRELGFFTESKYREALEYVKGEGNVKKLYGGAPDIEYLKHLTVLAGYHIKQGFNRFELFAKEMLSKFGEEVRPYLHKAWTQATAKIQLDKEVMSSKLEIADPNNAYVWRDIEFKYGGENRKERVPILDTADVGTLSATKNDVPGDIGTLGGQIRTMDRYFDYMDAANPGTRWKATLWRPYLWAERAIADMRESTHNQIDRINKILPSGDKWRRIGAFAVSQQTYGKKILEHMKIEIPKLNPTEIRIYNELTESLRKQWAAINRMRIGIGEEPIGFIENYSPFQLARASQELNRSGNDILTASRKAVERALDVVDFRYIHPRMSKFPFTKREAANYDIDLAFDQVYLRYMEIAARHQFMSPIAAKVRALVSTVSPSVDDLALIKMGLKNAALLTKNIKLSEQTPRWSRQLLEWSDYVLGKPPVEDLPELAKDVMFRLRNNIAFYTLSYSLRSSVVQFGAFAQALPYIGPKYMSKGINTILSSGKEGMRDAYEASAVLKARIGQYETAVADAIQYSLESRGFLTGGVGKAYAEARKTMGEFGLTLLKATDAITAISVWHGAHAKAKDMGMKGKDAIEWADDVVMKTQGSALRGHISPIQRRQWGKAITLFQTFAINQWGSIINDIMGFASGRKVNKVDATKKMLWLLTGYAAMNVFYEDILGVSSPFPTPFRRLAYSLKEGDSVPVSMLKAAREFSELAPIVGGSLKYGSHPLGPVFELFGQTGEVIGGRPGPKPSTAELIGKIFGVPGGGQMTKMYRRATQKEVHRQKDSLTGETETWTEVSRNPESDLYDIIVGTYGGARDTMIKEILKEPEIEFKPTKFEK